MYARNVSYVACEWNRVRAAPRVGTGWRRDDPPGPRPRPAGSVGHASTRRPGHRVKGRPARSDGRAVPFVTGSTLDGVSVASPSPDPVTRPPEIADSLLDLVGNTPLVRLGPVGRDLVSDLVAKVELFNPGGSVKDRPAIAMIDDAQRQSLLVPRGTVVEPTPR